MLVNKAIYICKTCLFPEAEAGDAPVQVSLAALELLSSLAQLNFENFSEWIIQLCCNICSYMCIIMCICM